MTPALPEERIDDPDLMQFMAASAEAESYLEELIGRDPTGLAELRRLLLEGLEGIEDEAVEAGDDWLESIAEGIRARAAAGAAGCK